MVGDVDHDKIMDDWKRLSGEEINISSNTFLDELVRLVNSLYSLSFKVEYRFNDGHHFVSIKSLEPSFTLMTLRYRGKISEERLKKQISRDFLRYLMFGKTTNFNDLDTGEIKCISVKDLRDKNY